MTRHLEIYEAIPTPALSESILPKSELGSQTSKSKTEEQVPILARTKRLRD